MALADEEIEAVAALVQACIHDNASSAQSQEEYNSRYNGLVKRYDRAVAKLNKLKAEIAIRQGRERQMGLFIESLQNCPLVLNEWNDQLWAVLVTKGIVHRDGSIEFEFKNGTKIKVGAE